MGKRGKVGLEIIMGQRYTRTRRTNRARGSKLRLQVGSRSTEGRPDQLKSCPQISTRFLKSLERDDPASLILLRNWKRCHW